jgi:ribonuclease P protein component
MERRLRLREEADFRRVRAAGRSWGNRWMTLLALPNALPHNRYGLVVGKRVGKAVARNLVKRRLRETLRELDRAGRIPPGHDLAFIVRPALAGATFAETRDAVADLLGRARLLDRPRPPAPPDGTAASGADGGERRVESRDHDQIRAGRD